jgi:hypothetical protein
LYFSSRAAKRGLVSYTAIRAFLEKIIWDQKTALFCSIGPPTILFEDENEEKKLKKTFGGCTPVNVGCPAFPRGV